jgi:glutathionylspermidine synthase
MLLSNKALLPVLWELFPGHPHLLPAYADTPANRKRFGGEFVRKPKLSREGANVTFFRGDHRIEETGGDYGSEGFILQEAAQLPSFDGNYPICGVWIVAHEACGLGIREDRSRITGNGSRFIPHFF